MNLYETAKLIIDVDHMGLGAGLSLVSGKIKGTGVLTGQWTDGESWSMTIASNPDTATIQVMPDPATLALLGLGAVALWRRKSRQASI